MLLAVELPLLTNHSKHGRTIMKTFEVNGTYGKHAHPCTLLVAEMDDGSHWYCIKGDKHAFQTYTEIEPGTYIEEVNDFNSFAYMDGLESLETFERAIKDEY